MNKLDVRKNHELRIKAFDLLRELKVKKEFVKIFFENFNTTKLKEEKDVYLQNWLNSGQ